MTTIVSPELMCEQINHDIASGTFEQAEQHMQLLHNSLTGLSRAQLVAVKGSLETLTRQADDKRRELKGRLLEHTRRTEVHHAYSEH